MAISKKTRLFNVEEAKMNARSHMSSIEQAIDLAGGACALANKLGISHQAVYAWIKRGWVPILRASEIEKTYGIPMIDLLKPDLASLLSKPVTK